VDERQESHQKEIEGMMDGSKWEVITAITSRNCEGCERRTFNEDLTIKVMNKSKT